MATQLLFLAKGRGITTFLIGHVTKDGSLAGPKSLEHIVDTVLYFEGEKRQHHRIVRAVKNRFGAVSELGVFEMTETGLHRRCPTRRRCSWPSGRWDRRARRWWRPLEGTRPMLVEVQALVSPTSFGTPRRMALGVDANRTNLLLAVLEKRVGLELMSDDVFVSVAGGLRGQRAGGRPGRGGGRRLVVPQPRRCPPHTVVFGEVGLAGRGARDRPARAPRARGGASWASRAACCPSRNLPLDVPGIELVGVSSLEGALERLFDED